jgi:hypothetical protein
MRILLDESLPLELKSELPGHDVHTVQDMEWAGLKNGELLARSADRFDALITADQNLRFQQNLGNLPVAVVVLVAKSNRIQDLRQFIPELLGTLSSLTPRTLVEVGG